MLSFSFSYQFPLLQPAFRVGDIENVNMKIVFSRKSLVCLRFSFVWLVTQKYNAFQNAFRDLCIDCLETMDKCVGLANTLMLCFLRDVVKVRSLKLRGDNFH